MSVYVALTWVLFVSTLLAVSSVSAVVSQQPPPTSPHSTSPSPPIRCDSEPAEPCIQLWPNGAPNETGFPPIPPESRKGDDGMGCGPARDAPCDHIFDVSIPTLSPFIVHNGTGASVIVAPGGGYQDLSWGKEGIDVARAYNAMGVSAFVLKYRVPARRPVAGLPHWWAPLQDAQRALSLVRASAHKWGLNANRIGFTGFSAGGHLTAHVSTSFNARAYAPIDAADNASCRPDYSILMYPWMLFNKNQVPPWGAAYNLSSDFSGISSAHPPAMLCQCADDPTAPVQGTLAYFGKLKALRAPEPVMHVYPTGGHGFGLCQTFKKYQQVCDWPSQAHLFLQNNGLAPGWPGM
eukprot:UC1_evm1s858